MSTAPPRRALFNRVFALSRKAARSGTGRVTEGISLGENLLVNEGEVAEGGGVDQDGFEDLDKYFAPSPHPVRTLAPMKTMSSERDEHDVASVHGDIRKGDAPGSPMPTEDNYEQVPMDEGYDMQVDEEVSIKGSVNAATIQNCSIPSDENVKPEIANELEAPKRTGRGRPAGKKSSPPVAASVMAEKNGKSIYKSDSSRAAEESPSKVQDSHAGAGAPAESGGKGEWYQALISKQRPKRNRIPPLAYWKNERVVYGRRLSSKIPVIVDVVRKEGEEEQAQRLLTRKRQRSAAKSKRKAANKSDSENEEESTEQNSTKNKSKLHPKPSSVSIATKKDLRDSGYKPDINFRAVVMDYDQHQEVERLLAVSEDKLNPAEVKGEKFKIQTVFGEGSFLSSGILIFPPDSNKPTRNSSKYALVFYVIEGTVEVTVHSSNFVIGTGGQFIIPRGNQYSIKSVWSGGDSRIFFCHCKDTTA